MVDDLTLENGSLSLEWRKGKLTLHNRLSGRSSSLDFPAFQIRLGAVDLHADRFEFQVSSASDTDVAFRYGHQATGIAAEVRYSLEGDRPWFRKRVDLQAPPVIAEINEELGRNAEATLRAQAVTRCSCAPTARTAPRCSP